MASTRNLRAYLETALKEPREQVATGHVPMPPVLYLVPQNQAQQRLDTDLLEMTSKILLELGENLVKKQTYNKVATAHQVLQAMVDTANAAQSSIIPGGGLSDLLEVRPPAPIKVRRKVLRENVHQEIIDVLFSHLDLNERACQGLDDMLKQYVEALSRLPTDAYGKNMIFTFYVSEVHRNNIGNEEFPRYEDVQSVSLHTLRMPTEVYHELVTKNKNPSKTSSGNATSPEDQSSKHASKKANERPTHSNEQRTSFLDVIWNVFGPQENTADNEDPEPPDEVTIEAEYRIISTSLKPKKFRKSRDEIDETMRRVMNVGMKEYAERATKVI
ncbi:hypothetical protein PENNAL_c0009G04119 [Penicillium nalgiovense]|uniref:Uncharacterized protein n=1 Tax=Penicillium nalgiovense TaxID=60175 RepID=A0A1V6YWR3_PENNA|nr:hypothetical protein PENNAL_c0009G04119 [Penicillium nalgiovense]